MLLSREKRSIRQRDFHFVKSRSHLGTKNVKRRQE